MAAGLYDFNRQQICILPTMHQGAAEYPVSSAILKSGILINHLDEI
jgi:hypothetical protein